jgi:hypothetical protein
MWSLGDSLVIFAFDGAKTRLPLTSQSTVATHGWLLEAQRKSPPKQDKGPIWSGRNFALFGGGGVAELGDVPGWRYDMIKDVRENRICSPFWPCTLFSRDLGKGRRESGVCLFRVLVASSLPNRNGQNS